MKVTVGLTPAEQVSAPVGIVIDVLRATSTICQAFAGGYESVTCVGEVEDARALAGPGVALAGERHNVRIEGFDYGNSPREFVGEPHAATKLVLTTTNGTRALLAAADRCETVLVASLLNLRAVADAARGVADVAIFCAGVEGAFAIDDAYVAGPARRGARRRARRLRRRGRPARERVRERRGGNRRRGQRREHPQRTTSTRTFRGARSESVLDLVPRVVERSETSVVVRLVEASAQVSCARTVGRADCAFVSPAVPAARCPRRSPPERPG